MVISNLSGIQNGCPLPRPPSANKEIIHKDDDLGTSDINMQPSNQIPLMYDEGR